MILNSKNFDRHEKLTNFINRKGITLENILAIVPRGHYDIILYWWADGYDYDDEEDW